MHLRTEPDNPADEHAVAVYSCRDVQLGYLPSERAVYIGALMRRGVDVRAIFQERTSWGAAVRVAFDGEEPQLPAAKMLEPDPFHVDAESQWYPDDDWPND